MVGDGEWGRDEGIAGDRGLGTESHMHSGYGVRVAGRLSMGKPSERVPSWGEQVEGIGIHMSSHHLCLAQLPSLRGPHGTSVCPPFLWLLLGKASAFALLDKFSCHQPPACPTAVLCPPFSSPRPTL